MNATFRMEDRNISMIRGDTLAFAIELLDENEERFTDDLDTAFFSCKSNKNDNVYLFRKSLDHGIEKAEDGLYKVRVAPYDTKEVEAGKYYYDLQIGVGDDVYTLMHGILEIEQDVTFGVQSIELEDGTHFDDAYTEATFEDIDNLF